jgi:hypothetical protein
MFGGIGLSYSLRSRGQEPEREGMFERNVLNIGPLMGNLSPRRAAPPRL